MPVPFQGLRGSGVFNDGTNNVAYRPTNYRELYTLLEPNGSAPFNALLAMGQSESTDDPQFNNFRDEMPERRLIVSGAVTNVATTLTLTNRQDNRFAVSGAVVLNARTGELFRLTADSSGVNNATLSAVTRGVGNGGTGVAMNDQDTLYIVGFAAAEGSSAPTPISFDADLAFNYTQIFRTSFAVTGTLDSTYLRTGNKFQESMTKALKLHMSDIERAMFFGRRDEQNANTAQPLRFTGGICNTLSSNVINIGQANAGINANAGRLTEAEFDALLISRLFAWGSKTKLAFVGPTVAALLQQIGKGRWQPFQVEGTYGVNLTGYKTFAGDLLIHMHPQFRMMSPGGVGGVTTADGIAHMANAMVVVDFPYVKYRYLEGRDTQLLENRQGTSEDRKMHEYLTECGLELVQEKVHSFVYNWRTIA